MKYRKYPSTNTVPQAAPGSWLSAQGLLNGSLSWSKILGSGFDVQLYGTNLTGEKYRISNSNQWTFTYFRASIYGEPRIRSEEHTSELKSLMRISYAVFCLKKKKTNK